MSASPSPLTRRAYLRLTLAALSASGCQRLSPHSPLIIATSWPESERQALETRLNLPPVSWVEPTGPADPTLLIARGFPAHFVLGGPASSYQRLALEDRLAAPWFASRVEPLGLALRPDPNASSPSAPIDLTNPSWTHRWQLPDPRLDPISLAWCRSILSDAEQSWPAAYARLVRSVSLAAPVSVPLDSPEILAFPTVASRIPHKSALQFLPDPRPSALSVEGMALVRAPEQKAQFAAVRRLMQEFALRNFNPHTPEPPDSLAYLESELLADLLGAILIDARPELSAARTAIDAHRTDPSARRAALWMVQPPPWPPASVQVLAARPDSSTLIAALAAQLVPDPRTRLWLLEHWNQPQRPLDGHLLTSLARAQDGRLASEPRFRTWLQGEWSAWAAQRFRRATRLALGFEPTPTPTPNANPENPRA